MRYARTWRVVGAVLAVAMLASACGSDKKKTTTNTEAPKGPPKFAAGSAMEALQQKGLQSGNRGMVAKAVLRE